MALRDVTGPAITSSEIRLRLVRYGAVLANEHYLLGAGYNHYAQIHEQAVRRDVGASPQADAVLAGPWVRTDNPHAEYLMQLVGGGLVALALFLGWLAAPLCRRDANGRTSTAIAGTVLAFAVGCLFNSLLMDFVEGHFYTALLAWLLARQARPAGAA
jgi:O-antigen ligase